MSFPLDDDTARASHDPAADLPEWRQPATSEVLLGAAAPSLDELAERIGTVLADQARAEVADLDESLGGPAVVVEFRGVRVFVRTAADAISAEDAPEGAEYAGGIEFPAENPSFQGPLNAARGLAIWNNNAGVLLHTVERIRLAAEVYEPAVDGPSADAPIGADPYVDALREELALATITAVLTTVESEPLGVWVPLAGMTLPAGVYRDTVVNAPLPIPALVGVRVGVYTESDESQPVTFGFTTGMYRFGRADMEMVERPTPPQETLGAMFELVAFELGTTSIFEPGTPVDLQDGRVFDVAAGPSPITGWNLLQLTQRGL